MTHALPLAAAIAIVSTVGSSAHAENRARAREAYQAASQHYDLGEFQQALELFKEAYRNYEEPAFLFNIAQCHRALGQTLRPDRGGRSPDAVRRCA